MTGKLLTALCAMFLAASCVGDGDEPEYVSILAAGDRAPAFEVTLNDGSTFVSPDDFAGRETDIVLFSTTCPDCRVFLRKLQDSHGGARVLCISRAEGEADVAAYWKEEGLTLPYAAVPDRSVYNLFARSGIPRLYKVSEAGIIIAVRGPSELQ